MGADSDDGSTPLSSCLGTTTAKSSSNMPTHRHQPASSSSRATSAAGASAAVSIAMPPTRPGHKGSVGGAAGWAGVLGFGGRQHVGFKGHHGHQYGFLAGSRRQLTCLAVLLMLPMGFLVTTHLLSHYSSSSSTSSSSKFASANWIARRAAVADSTSSSGGGGTDNSSSSSASVITGDSSTVAASRKRIDLDNLDLSKWQPLPKNYAAAKAIITAAKSDSESSGSSSSSGGDSVGGGKGEFHCIPPSRALPWDQVDAEISQKTTAAAAGAASGQADEDEVEQEQQQEQQQQAGDELAAYNRRLQQQQQTAAPLPAAGSTIADSDVISFYYDIEAAAAPAVPNAAALGTSQSLNTPQAAAADGSSSSKGTAATAAAAADGDSSAWEMYYDPEAAADGELAAAGATGAAEASAGTFVAAAANRVSAAGTTAAATNIATGAADTAATTVAAGAGAAAAPAATKPSAAGSQPTSSSGTEQEQQPQQTPSSQQSSDSAVDTKSGSSSTAGSTNAGSTNAGSTTVTTSGSSSSSSSSASTPPPPVDVSAVVSQLRIALINDVEFHHEVTLGLMSALQKHKDRLTVYLHNSVFKPQESTSSSSFDFVSYVNSVMPGNKLVNAYYKEGITKTDVAIFVSPEFSITYYREFIRRATPRMLIIFIHEPNMQLSRLQYIINMHPLVGVVTLSPHVAETVRSRMHMNFVHWMMPVLPVPCSNTCWEGFAVQGKFEGSRRNYASLWEAMSKQLADSKPAPTGPGPARHLHHQAGQHIVPHIGPQEQATQLQTQALQVESVGSTAQAGSLFDFERGVRLLSSGATWRNRGKRSRSLHSSGRSSSDGKTPLQGVEHTDEQWGGEKSNRGLQEVAAAAAAGGGGMHSSGSSNINDTTLLEPALHTIEGLDSKDTNRDLQQVTAAGTAAALPRINLMGSGALTQLAVPNELRPYVFLYRNLGYKEYYDTLCRSTALLPLFNASGGYLRDKISSTVLASVATGVPMIVPAKFLEVYQAFKAEHVVVMDEATSAAQSPELAVMLSLSAPTAQATILAPRRKALEHLRYILNAQATAKLEGLMAAAHGRPHATTKQD